MIDHHKRDDVHAKAVSGERTLDGGLAPMTILYVCHLCLLMSW